MCAQKDKRALEDSGMKRLHELSEQLRVMDASKAGDELRMSLNTLMTSGKNEDIEKRHRRQG